jgi:uncharacterized membrane protein
MNWYYADGTKQVGPLTDADFESLVRSGTITPETLVWREGFPSWQPYRQVAPASAPAGEPPPSVLPAGVTAEQVMAREYDADIGGCLNSSWDQYKNNFGITLGATALVMGVLIACSMLPFGIGAIAQIILQGPLMGGLYVFYLRLSRGQAAGINDAFSGFGPRFTNLMLTHIVSSLLAGVALLPAGVLFAVWFFTSVLRSGHARPELTFGPLFVVAVVLGVIGLCVSWYLTTCWTLALPLAADKGLKFGEAMKLSRHMVRKHWWMTFGFMLVAGLIGAAGILGCFVGVIFTMPITFGMITYLYKRNFEDLTPSA